MRIFGQFCLRQSDERDCTVHGVTCFPRLAVGQPRNKSQPVDRRYQAGMKYVTMSTCTGPCHSSLTSLLFVAWGHPVPLVSQWTHAVCHRDPAIDCTALRTFIPHTSGRSPPDVLSVTLVNKIKKKTMCLYPFK